MANRLRLPGVWPHGGRRLGDGRFMCSGCGTRTSVTAATICDRTRTLLTVWFAACWLFATGKDGVSAPSLKRALEIGYYQTAWAMLHRLRSVLVRPGRDRLDGAVEVDETHMGGFESGLAGGRAPGKKGPGRGMLFYRLLELAVLHAPVRYEHVIATKRSRAKTLEPPSAWGHPPTLEGSRLGSLRLNGYPQDM